MSSRTIVLDYDMLLRVVLHDALRRIGVIRVLDQLDDGHFRLFDQPLAQFPEHPRFDGKLSVPSSSTGSLAATSEISVSS